MIAVRLAVLGLLAITHPVSVEAGDDDHSNNNNNDGSFGESSISPNLPFGDINVVVLTDVHSWVGSHRRQQPYYDVDLGDALSFWQRLKEHCDGNEVDDDDDSVDETVVRVKTGTDDHDDDDPEPKQKCVDVFFVNNGDFVHGTGLTRIIDDESDPEYIIPLLEKMPYDAVNVGNHELYNKRNTDYMTRPGGYVDWWGDRYLTSNIHKRYTPGTDIIAMEGRTYEPLGSRYKILRGRNSNVLAFGFLYNFNELEHGANIGIEKVQSAVAQSWFADALTEEDYDAVLVLAHMDLVDPLVEVIRTAIRDILGDEGTPVVFITGHTHYRGVKQLEDLTMTFEAGKYMDTVGFVSFPKKDSVVRGRSGNGNDNDNDASSLFRHVFLDTNRKLLFEDTLGFPSFEDGQTKDGKDLSEFIDRTRTKLGLETEIGCAPHSYFIHRHVDAPDSLWGLYRDEVVPKMFSPETNDDLPAAMLLSSGTWRYDLYSNSSLVVDDVYAIAPFNETVVYLGAFSTEVVLEANRTLNGHHEHIGDTGYGDGLSSSLSSVLPRFVLIGDFGESDPPATKYHLYTHSYGGEVQRVLKKLAPPDEPVVSEKTEFVSSLMWLSYVRKHWPCGGGGGGVTGNPGGLLLRGSAASQARGTTADE